MRTWGLAIRAAVALNLKGKSKPKTGRPSSFIADPGIYSAGRQRAKIVGDDENRIA